MSDPFEEEMALIGRISSAWNDIEHTWYIMYSLMMHKTPKNVRDAIYKLSKTGASQRDLTMAVSNEILAGTAELIELRTELGVACARTQAVASQRNEVVHGHYRLGGNAEGVRLAVIAGDEFGKPNRLAGKPLFPELIRVSQEIEEIRVGEIDSIWRKLNARFPTTS